MPELRPPWSSTARVALAIRLWRVRARGTGRTVRSIARAEPLWLVAVVGVVVGGAVFAAPRILHPSRPWLPAAVVVLLAGLLERTRTDDRLVALLGGRPAVVRFVDAMLWLAPLLVLLAVAMPASAPLAILGIAAVALLPAWRAPRSRGASRPRRAHARLVSLDALEWIAGLRRTPLPLAAGTVAGIFAPADPLLVAAAMLVATLSATSFHWAPSAGWLLIHVAGRGPRAWLWRKVAVSCALLGLALGAVAASAALRAPSLAPVFLGLALLCLVAHAGGILSRWAEYAEGAPLSAGGMLTWLVTVAALALPPVAVALMYYLERRAVARLAPYARAARGAVHGVAA